MKFLKQVWAAAQRSSYGVAIPAKQSGSDALPDGESAIAQFELRVVSTDEWMKKSVENFLAVCHAGHHH